MLKNQLMAPEAPREIVFAAKSPADLMDAQACCCLSEKRTFIGPIVTGILCSGYRFRGKSGPSHTTTENINGGFRMAVCFKVFFHYQMGFLLFSFYHPKTFPEPYNNLYKKCSKIFIIYHKNSVFFKVNYFCGLWTGIQADTVLS